MRIFLFFPLLLFCLPLLSQRVIQSEELNIRSHVAYHIIGKIDDTVLLYQDKGFEKEIILFDNNMVKLSERTPTFDKKRVFVLDISSKTDSVFHIIYGYKQKSEDFVKINTYNKNVELVDSSLISVRESNRFYAPNEAIFSEDESKIAIYKIHNNEDIQLIVYDIRNRETLIDEVFTFQSSVLEQDLIQTLLTNDGEFWLLLDHYNTRSKKEKHYAEIFSIKEQQGILDEIVIPLNDILSTDVFLSYDNVSGRLGLFGLYSEKGYEQSEGFFFINQPPHLLQNTNLVFHEISDGVLNDLYGRDARMKKGVDNFVVADVVWRADGGVLLILEMSFDYYRRPNYYNSYEPYDSNRPRTWTNHLNEDMILYSLSTNLEIEWSKVMYKRQRSQDDQGIYSSFFPFKTPSRLRLIFNDEIKSNNTVSEYILDSYGRYKRNSLLSTEYQNLRLRIKDAVQVSSSELLVPSQLNGLLSLVKIDYE